MVEMMNLYVGYNEENRMTLPTKAGHGVQTFSTMYRMHILINSCLQHFLLSDFLYSLCSHK